jgi:hypothetical protein
MARLSGSLASLRHANFRWYFLAGAVNTAGSTMAGVALAFGPLGVALGLRQVIAVAGAAYVVIALLPLASRSVRGLRRVPVEESVMAAG